ncbi:helix-turn-helix domain-containing protein [Anaerosporobacter faecicola]|uniref:helix-turn-helix domain-containing protein n=1 Tax=Anaerosporobacter faecicola TaxID=2718714 RepID=UPI00143BD50B|nr:helix-turn-helix domain-containing protein [Anaerosporobacter faecicola]
MFKILIAERNSEYIQMIKNMIDHSYPNCEVAHIVGTSREVIELLAKDFSGIDIAFINIEITGVNGLQAIRKVRKKNLETRIIILSEYSYLAFAREAIRLKADEFITLPTNENELRYATELCLDEIEKNNVYKQNICSVTNKYREAKIYIEYSLIYTIVFNRLTTKDIKKYIELLDIGTHGCMINVEFYSDNVKMINKQSVSIQVYDVFHEYENAMIRFAVGPRVGKRVVCYVSFDKTIDGIKLNLVDILHHIKKVLDKKLGVCVQIGLGREEDIGNIYASYQDSIRSLRIEGESGKQYIEKKKEYYDSNLYKDLEKKFLISLRMKDGEGSNYLNNLLDCLDLFSDDAKKSKIIELLALTRHVISGVDWERYTQVSFLEYLNQIEEIPANEIKAWAHQKFEFIQHSQIDQTRLYSKAVSDALNIVEAEFKENITLEEVAKRVGVSSQYLSKIFKEETKDTFIEYLTRRRINQAKEIIQTSDYPLKQIGLMVGYKDPNYFSRTFRSVENMSPKDFRDMIKKRRNEEQEEEK